MGIGGSHLVYPSSVQVEQHLQELYWIGGPRKHCCGYGKNVVSCWYLYIQVKVLVWSPRQLEFILLVRSYSIPNGSIGFNFRRPFQRWQRADGNYVRFLLIAIVFDV